MQNSPRSQLARRPAPRRSPRGWAHGRRGPLWGRCRRRGRGGAVRSPPPPPPRVAASRRAASPVHAEAHPLAPMAAACAAAGRLGGSSARLRTGLGVGHAAPPPTSGCAYGVGGAPAGGERRPRADGAACRGAPPPRPVIHPLPPVADPLPAARRSGRRRRHDRRARPLPAGAADAPSGGRASPHRRRRRCVRATVAAEGGGGDPTGSGVADEGGGGGGGGDGGAGTSRTGGGGVARSAARADGAATGRPHRTTDSPAAAARP
ncbi:hypothetical protein BU14_0057s0025 [Porphyra umbilicalis]|uniref:Uncharacterized protein n=1 Tax=Porphyra umbilicalis TaxID=2786 RepID=A0A1X6PH51_PORUM|nr:hypothetical protein BU14_0057s0025 [Porphyra umbilicalis]|eukprot:OSX80204.1 hypothetical protein BU14_0057s0025 [Porphyra umbilicalis]